MWQIIVNNAKKDTFLHKQYGTINYNTIKD